MRFNRKGKFNVPFCRKPERFAKAYITKIANQIAGCSSMLKSVDWEFRISDFRQTLSEATFGDMVYADPPYAGRHVDYYNSWSDLDESDLVCALKSSSANFVLSTWYQNKYRKNETVDSNWRGEQHTINFQEHFYHVGSSEELRNSMIEALVSNFSATIRPKLLVKVPTLLDALEI